MMLPTIRDRRSTSPRSSTPLATIVALALVFCAQAAWCIATTSGTYDETTYLGLGRLAYVKGDTKLLADWGIAPLPVLVVGAAPVVAGTTRYRRSIALARISAVVVFGIPLVAIAYWTLLAALGPAAALAGTSVLVLSPNIVANASLASTDVCFLTAGLAALAALANDVGRRTWRSRALLAGALALALAAKYSALCLFVVVTLVSYAAGRRRSESAVRSAAGAAALAVALFAIALLFVWALHAFAMVPFGLPPIEDVKLPAPIVGIARQLHHESLGHQTFLLGERSVTGWWYYIPAALAMKSTPAELVLWAFAFVAVSSGWRRGTGSPEGLHYRSYRNASVLVWRVAFVVFAALALGNRIDIGVRYVLILVPLTIFLTLDWWFHADRRGRGIVMGALVAAQLFSAAAIAPHDLSYFNVFAGGPENGWRRLADSNVDWGQDLPALRHRLTALGSKRALLSYFGTAPVEDYVHADAWDAAVTIPFERWDWVAISATNLDGVYLDRDPFEAFRTLTPGDRAGYSILLYPTSRDDVRRAMAVAAARLR